MDPMKTEFEQMHISCSVTPPVKHPRAEIKSENMNNHTDFERTRKWCIRVLLQVKLKTIILLILFSIFYLFYSDCSLLSSSTFRSSCHSDFE